MNVARSRPGLRSEALTSEIWALRRSAGSVRTTSANFVVSQNVSLSGRLPRTLPPGIRRGRRLWPLRIEPPVSPLERRYVPFVPLSLLGFPRSDDQRMTRFIHAHLHCIFSLLSQRSLRKEAASLNPDKVFLRSREDAEPLTPGPVFRSGRSRAEGLRICLPSVFLWERITGRQIIPLARRTDSKTYSGLGFPPS